MGVAAGMQPRMLYYAKRKKPYPDCDRVQSEGIDYAIGEIH